MGESTCLLQPFSHSPPDAFYETQEANPIHALGDSVSFGRFMNEPLAWEKWSSFNNNRYLEEVERYSKPGSVAQKKAYFEAHYKKIAAQKAAVAALEEEDSVTINSSLQPQPECGNGVCDAGTPGTELVGSDCCWNGKESAEAVGSGMSVDAKECDFKGKIEDLESVKVEVDLVMEDCVLPKDSSIPAGSPDQREEFENTSINKVEFDTTMSPDKLPLKENSSVNKESSSSTMKRKPTDSSSKASVYSRASKAVFSPARLTTLASPRKENNPTLSSKKAIKDTLDKRRPSATSLHMSLNFTKSCASERSTVVIPRTRDSRVFVSSTKTANNFSSPLRTPATMFGNAVPMLPPVDPRPGSKRTKEPIEHKVNGSRKMDVKWKSLSLNISKASSTCENKRQSSSVSSSFSLRSEERAAKRKEYFQKLEEEHHAKEAEKLQLLAKSKEKAENELKKLRQNLGFKAKPMPDFNREAQTAKSQLKKIPLTRPRSPKLGRKSGSSGASHETGSWSSKAPSVNSDGSSKQSMDRSSRPPSRSIRSTPKKNAHENASPNIQK